MLESILQLTIIAILLPCTCQDAPDYSLKKNELNLGYFNAFDLYSVGELGVGYKRLGEKGAFRTGLGMNFTKDKRDLDTYQEVNTYYDLSPRIGYEFHQWFKRIRLHYGGDFVADFAKSSWEDIAEDPVNDRISTYKRSSLGIRPILGLTVYLSKSVSIATETYMDIAFSRTIDERTDNSGTDSYERSGMIVGLGPLGIISVNLHF
jgi:hypothetical protein